MKTVYTVLVTLLFSISSFAQQSINYKAQIKDNNGNIVASQNVSLQFTILDAPGGGTPLFEESQYSVQTDANGIVIINIGEGEQSLSYGDFEDINWGSGEHYLKLGIDLTGGFTYTDMGTTKFVAVPYALNVSGLEKIKEFNPAIGYDNIGWRLIGESPDIHGYIGYGAVDMSTGFSGSTIGATGDFSYAVGLEVKASGKYSVAMGEESNASGESAFAMGNNTYASGDYAVAMGYTNSASGDHSTAIGNDNSAIGNGSIAIGDKNYATGSGSIALGTLTRAYGGSTALGDQAEAIGYGSTAIGKKTVASGNSSTALGNYSVASGSSSIVLGVQTVASGDNSTAMGLSTTAKSYAETVIGAYNEDYIILPDSISWRATDRIFVIGNGISSSFKHNALTVLKNGNIGINTSSPESLLEVTHHNGAPTSNFRNAFSIRNSDTNHSWQFYTSNYLNLYKNGVFKGSWNSNSGAYVQASDRRVKKDIIAMENGTLNKVMQLNPVSYLMKDQTNTTRNMGLISQEVQEIFPSIIHYIEETDLLTLSYTELIPILVKALQEQQSIIEAQNEKLNIQNTSISEQGKSIIHQGNSIEALAARLNDIESKSNY